MAKILNVGSINIDYVYQVPHFVRPGETLASTGMQPFPGGKGLNQSVALARAGAQVYHAGRTGADGLGMVKLLAEAGVNVQHIDTGAEATGHAIIQVDSAGQNCILLFAGANHQLERPFLSRVLAGFAPGDVLVLQNEVNDIGWLMEKAREGGLRVAFNPSPFTPEIPKLPLDAVNWFLLNEIEGAALTGESGHEAVLAAMRRRFPAAAVVLTLGKQGVLYQDAEARLAHGIYKVPVVDTTAAGDTFTGFFLACVIAGKDPKEALRLASVASSIAVGRRGAASSIPSLAEVEGAKLIPGTC